MEKNCSGWRVFVSEHVMDVLALTSRKNNFLLQMTRKLLLYFSFFFDYFVYYYIILFSYFVVTVAWKRRNNDHSGREREKFRKFFGTSSFSDASSIKFCHQKLQLGFFDPIFAFNSLS